MVRRIAPVVAVVALLGACSAEPVPAEDPVAAPAITADESYKVLRDWAARHGKALASGRKNAWKETVTGALAGPVGARSAANGRLPDSARISLANPVLYVPRLTGYPKWFAVAALERGDRPGQVLALFVRRAENDAWRAAHWLPYKGRPPEIALDPQGYAVATEPGGLADLHARYLATGADDRFAPDAFSQSARRTGGGSTFDASVHPSYALRTGDGGALVWYAFDQTRTLPVAAHTPDVRAHLTRTRAAPSARAQVKATWTWLTIGYLPATGKSHVLGESVTLTAAS